MESQISFVIDEVEYLRLTPEGFYVKGIKINSSSAEAWRVYETFVQWLEATSGGQSIRTNQPDPTAKH